MHLAESTKDTLRTRISFIKSIMTFKNILIHSTILRLADSTKEAFVSLHLTEPASCNIKDSYLKR